MIHLGTPITEADRIAPPGKFRIVCIDLGPEIGGKGEAEIFLVRDLDDRDKAIAFVKEEDGELGDPYIRYQAHDDKGSPLVP